MTVERPTPWSMNESMKRFIKRFVNPHRQHRWLELYSDGRGRELLGSIAHGPSGELDRRYIIDVPRHERTVEAAEKALLSYGKFSDCVIASIYREHEGLTLPLRQALERTWNDEFMALLLCIPGKLCFLIGEYSDERYILYRP